MYEELNIIIREVLQDPYTTSIYDAVVKIQARVDIDGVRLIYLINNIMNNES